MTLVQYVNKDIDFSDGTLQTPNIILTFVYSDLRYISYRSLPEIK